MGHVKCYEIAFVLLCVLLIIASSWAQSCGRRKVVNFLIMNGTEAKDGYWPWHAAIYHNNQGKFVYKCGGTILNQYSVLTAAHCVMVANGMIAKNRLLVDVGRNRLNVASNRVQKLHVFQFIIHPEFNVNSVEHDIALVMLATDIKYTNYVQPICLWNRNEDLNTIVGTLGTLVGFGVDETDNPSNTLRETTIPVVSHNTCIQSNRAFFAMQLTLNMFCAGNRNGTAACNGDSGGGLFFKYNGVWFVRGIVSFSKPREYVFGCDSKEYTVFTDVAKYLSWIEEHIYGMVTVNSHKFRLLPMSTCGPNPHAGRNESSKPVMLGYPWMGAVECILQASFTKVVFCQAALISDLYLVTSAHVKTKLEMCFTSAVWLGEYDFATLVDCAEIDGQRVCSPPVQRLRIESVITHPNYRKQSLENDIALIRLQDRADTTQSNVKPICLPVTEELRSPKSTHYTLTSWNNAHDKVLKRSLYESMKLDECQELYEDFDVSITTHHICMKHNEKACSDSTSTAPLQHVQEVEGQSRYVLHGILLDRASCTAALPVIFTNVASYIDWILETIKE